MQLARSLPARVLTVAAITTVSVFGVRAYANAEDPPLWPRGDRFCDSAEITELVPAESYVDWPLTEGKAVVTIGEGRYFHPVSAGLNAITALLNDDVDRAEQIADWMYSHGVDGWLAYDFDWEWPEGSIIEAPWYSAMAQGVALSVYSRLGQRERADQTFETVVEMQRDDGWLPEYPAGPDVLNGHVFATFGLHDYWRLTGRGEGETLLAIQAVADRLSEWRRVGRVSRYAGSYPALGQYHDLHVMLLKRLADITGEPCFDRASDAFASDA